MTAEPKSHLDEFLKGRYSLEGYQSACQADWEQGEPIDVGDDGNGMGPAVDGHRWVGYVGVAAGDRQLHEFRAVPTDNPRRRRVFAVDPAGRAFYIGMLAKRVRYSRNPHTVIRGGLR